MFQVNGEAILFLLVCLFNWAKKRRHQQSLGGRTDIAVAVLRLLEKLLRQLLRNANQRANAETGCAGIVF